jgi:dienelactone hydrolase
MMRLLRTFILLALCLPAPGALAATPPKQPEKGPGGAGYKFAEVTKRGIGTVSAGTFVFYGAESSAEPRPVAVLLHSWGAVNSALYGGFIDHLARSGYLVLFPRFQEVNRTRPVEATANAATLIDASLKALAQDGDVKPDLARVAFIGHLAGVPMALNLAATHRETGLPKPGLIFGFMPGGIAADEKARGIVLSDLSQVDAGSLLVLMNGDREQRPADRSVRVIFEKTTGIPASRKLFVRAASDDHGFPAISATLASPASPKPAYDAKAIKLADDPPKDPKERSKWRWSADMSLSGEQTILTAQMETNPTDALDYLAYWKTFDLAAQAAFGNGDATTLRRDPRTIDMSQWSDGWPVRRLSAELAKGAEAEKEAPGPRRRLN